VVPAVAVLCFVEWLKRLFRQPLPALLRFCQVSRYFGKTAEIAQLLACSQYQMAADAEESNLQASFSDDLDTRPVGF